VAFAFTPADRRIARISGQIMRRRGIALLQSDEFSAPGC